MLCCILYIYNICTTTKKVVLLLHAAQKMVVPTQLMPSAAYYQSSMPISFTHRPILIIYFFRCQDSTTSTSLCGPELPYCNTTYLSAKHVCMYVYRRTHIRQNLKLGTVSSSQASSKIIAYLFTGRNLGKQIITMLRQLIVVSYLLVFSEVTNTKLKNDD